MLSIYTEKINQLYRLSIYTGKKSAVYIIDLYRKKSAIYVIVFYILTYGDLTVTRVPMNSICGIMLIRTVTSL